MCKKSVVSYKYAIFSHSQHHCQQHQQPECVLSKGRELQWLECDDSLFNHRSATLIPLQLLPAQFSLFPPTASILTIPAIAMNVISSLTSPSSCPHLYHSPSYPSNTTISDATNTANEINYVILRHYNYTGRLQNRTFSNTQNHISVSIAVFLFFSIFIILENLVVLVAVISHICHRQRWVYVCIANTTLSDLLTGAAYLVNICMSGSQTFRLTPALWLFREGMLFVALAASIFSLLLIAVERYTTMMKPLAQKSARKTYYRIYVLVALCWVLALVIGFLPLLGWNCVCSLNGCSTLLPLYSKTYILFSLLIFLLILLAIGVLYGAIYCHVHRSAQLSPHRSRKRSLALLKTVITIVGVFMICWGPLFLLLLVDFFCASRQCALLFSADYFISLAVLNSSLNPIIYALGSSEMRKAIAELLCCCCLKASLCHPDKFTSKDTSSTSESKRDSLRNSFYKVRNLSVASPPSTPSKTRRAQRKCRLSSTTSCLSVSSG
ncbi:sphingosine 1-phosphate receptor 4 [Xiphias gladius]|uniref:sphingosine 1-phosphate receptor 4 n=1 Tax=Xiphias gladius TaxID=8245 RepID=UPI001A98AF10|nr:sphingosine 1-phosphate receptor 4 [Xiphias gladius]